MDNQKLKEFDGLFGYLSVQRVYPIMPLEYALQFRGQFPDAGPWKRAPTIATALSTLPGISDLPKQQALKSKNRRFRFNIMVCGAMQ